MRKAISVAYHTYSNSFRAFFGRINPSASFERTAASEYASVRALIEDRFGPAAALAPVCFLQGSYRQQTATYTINDVDIVALCALWHPGSGSGPSWTRDQVFTTVAAPLLNDRRYRDKVRYASDSMCIKVDLAIRLEILPVVYKAGNSDADSEPFRLYRPGSGQWEDGYARYHQQWLTWKNGAEHAGGNFIPAVKVFKHLRSWFGADAVSFHLECLLFSLPDGLSRGGPADYIPALLDHIAAWSAAAWYAQQVQTPCRDRDIFVPIEWAWADWVGFHNLVTRLAPIACAVSKELDWDSGLQMWQSILGADFFPGNPRA